MLWFLGSNMCQFLIEKNYSVIGLDNLLTGTLKNIESLHRSERFRFIKQDVCSEIKK